MRLVKAIGCTLMFVTGLVPIVAHAANETPPSLQGNWTALKAMREGSAVDDVVGHRLSFSGDRFEIRSRDGKPLYAGTFRLTASALACTPAIGAWMMGREVPSSFCRIIFVRSRGRGQSLVRVNVMRT